MQIKSAPITSKSYVPAGMTASEYARIRAEDEKKKEQNYAKNVNKAFKYLGFNEFYQKRGTDLNQGWVKSPTKGHRMAKTKYDFQNIESKKPEAFSVGKK